MSGVGTNVDVGMFNGEMNIQKQDKRSGKSACARSVVGDAIVPFFVDLFVRHNLIIIGCYSN